MPSIDFSHLSQREPNNPERIDVADIPKAELDRRNAAFPVNRTQAVPWPDVRAKLHGTRRLG